ncbi:GIY-YIG nuclease family protein [Natrinema sp. H-ect1]|uniref:GIY-YIG nuclease family protein n=1 Tax=Natrinema sp. H-ect1 TaxID=3242700 RepID=UPI00359DD92F
MDISELAQEFDFVDTVTVERNDVGKIDLKMPHHRYEKSDETPVHKHGWGPFCKFYIDTADYQKKAGVYVFTANHKVMYVGEALDIHSRIYSYSNISPKNCFKGGQRTNCRINNAILEVIRNRGQVALWAIETADRKQREAALIEECSPPWNFESPATITANQQQITHTDGSESDRKSARSDPMVSQQHAGGKYAPLYKYLREADTTTIQLTFEGIEEILDAPLPESARNYKPWWHPAGHSHAEGWAELGWTADPDLDSETVTFERSN